MANRYPMIYTPNAPYGRTDFQQADLDRATERDSYLRSMAEQERQRLQQPDLRSALQNTLFDPYQKERMALREQRHTRDVIDQQNKERAFAEQSRMQAEKAAQERAFSYQQEKDERDFGLRGRELDVKQQGIDAELKNRLELEKQRAAIAERGFQSQEAIAQGANEVALKGLSIKEAQIAQQFGLDKERISNDKEFKDKQLELQKAEMDFRNSVDDRQKELHSVKMKVLQNQLEDYASKAGIRGNATQIEERQGAAYLDITDKQNQVIAEYENAPDKDAWMEANINRLAGLSGNGAYGKTIENMVNAYNQGKESQRNLNMQGLTNLKQQFATAQQMYRETGQQRYKNEAERLSRQIYEMSDPSTRGEYIPPELYTSGEFIDSSQVRVAGAKDVAEIYAGTSAEGGSAFGYEFGEQAKKQAMTSYAQNAMKAYQDLLQQGIDPREARKIVRNNAVDTLTRTHRGEYSLPWLNTSLNSREMQIVSDFDIIFNEMLRGN